MTDLPSPQPPIPPLPEGGDSSTGDLAESQVGTPKVGGVSPSVAPIIPAPKKFSFLLLILIPVLVMVAVISIYFMLQFRAMYQEAISTPTPSPSPVASIDPTANWQTYVHPTYKYEFKYPPTWSVVVSKNASANVFFGLTANQLTGVGGVEIREINGDPQKYHNLNGEDIENQQLITLSSGINGYKSQIVSSPKGSDFVFKNTDGLIYHIFINSTEPQDLEIFDQILSTFKFTE